MVLVCKGGAIINSADSASPKASRIARMRSVSDETMRTRRADVPSLDDEAGYESVKDCVVIVAVQTVLQEVPGCQRCLLCEQLNHQVARGRVEKHFGRRGRLEVVECGHDDRTSATPPVNILEESSRDLVKVKVRWISFAIHMRFGSSRGLASL